MLWTSHIPTVPSSQPPSPSLDAESHTLNRAEINCVDSLYLCNYINLQAPETLVSFIKCFYDPRELFVVWSCPEACKNAGDIFAYEVGVFGAWRVSVLSPAYPHPPRPVLTNRVVTPFGEHMLMTILCSPWSISFRAMFSYLDDMSLASVIGEIVQATRELWVVSCASGRSFLCKGLLSEWCVNLKPNTGVHQLLQHRLMETTPSTRIMASHWSSGRECLHLTK